MEAMSHELPVVATRVAAIPEVVLDEVTGLLVPPEDATALSRALEWLARDPERRLRMGREGRRHILERFAFEPGIERLAVRFGLSTKGRKTA